MVATCQKWHNWDDSSVFLLPLRTREYLISFHASNINRYRSIKTNSFSFAFYSQIKRQKHRSVAGFWSIVASVCLLVRLYVGGNCRSGVALMFHTAETPCSLRRDVGGTQRRLWLSPAPAGWFPHRCPLMKFPQKTSHTLHLAEWRHWGTVLSRCQMAKHTVDKRW